ncbi:NAD(P)H-dependent oxidoreductase [Streptomyces sp. NPDC007369]|uniref:NAD(P)H-dependent oxidoreductase n=1 Tax=Streptomyces sp. NPDC007369 TaxID=3154589 RepID=UPI0033C14AAD
MKVGLYLAHPRAGSFNHALFEAVRETLADAGCEVFAHDLCAEAFPPVLAAQETETVDAAPPAADPLVALHRAQVAELDALVLVHPNWWGMPPAVLTGWVQRVLVPGVAYKLGRSDGEPAGLLRAGRALVLNTSDTPGEREEAEFGDPLEQVWASCVLPYVGVTDVRRTVFRTVSDSTPAQRAAWLEEARRQASALLTG